MTTIPGTHPEVSAVGTVDGARPVATETVTPWRMHLGPAGEAARAGRSRQHRGLA
jgi:hypothetical protein